MTPSIRSDAPGPGHASVVDGAPVLPDARRAVDVPLAGEAPRAPDAPVAPDAPIARPDARFMLARPSRCIAMGLGSGLSPVAAGTVGTLWAWAVFAIGSLWIGPLAWFLVALAALPIGVWACGRTARDLGVDDHGAIVWDEIGAFWLVLAVLPPTPGWHLAGFLVFRAFDILKPPPIRWLDDGVPGGLGVMIDDYAAAFATLLVLAWWRA